MASVTDYGKVAGDKLNAPKLGGTDGWAAAIAAALNNSDATVDTRIATAVGTKAPLSHSHLIADLPTGTSGTTVALGNHTHSTYALTSHSHVIGDLPTGTSGTTVALGNHLHAGVYASVSHSHLIADLPTGTTGTTVALGNHTHTGVYEASGTVATHAATAGHELLSSTAPAALGVAAAVGVGTTTARADHVHIYPTLGQLGAAATSHTHVIGDLPTGTSGTTVAIGNHTHSYEASGAVATHDALATAHSALRGTVAPLKIQIGSAAAVGTSTKFAREDHLHDVSYGTPVALGSANAAGNASTFAASNHVHIFPTAADVGAATTAYVDSRAEVAVSNTQPATRDNLDIWINTTPGIGDVVANTYLPLAGGTMTGNLVMAADKNINAYAGASGGGAYLNQLEVYEGKAQFYRGAYTAIVPVASGDLTNKTYVDSRIWFGTLAAYNAIGTKDPLVLYVVTG